ncbi:CrcB family protein [uncultured Thermosynechococcus sp.]|uniref:fluoride efflux transporter FluC n=1 Tax=uncultured Thermosynechococcus sp. TaxID=436945 RepID=UPI00262427FB|nr:CrcB family protein [uncultured Thermosynechococcus sp.]
MISPEGLLAIALGAVPGALIRYSVGLWSDRRFGTPIFGTLSVNLAGAFLMGWLSHGFSRWGVPLWLSYGVTVGFLGALTTFSTFILEVSNLRREGYPRIAWFYWLGTPLVGFLGVELGISLSRAL